MSQLDLFYISYDEPNCEEKWAKLLTIAPWAKRVHGVKGFDAAHKECAKQSETSHFITIDGDNELYPEFLDITCNVPVEYNDCVLSWASKNVINGLIYGNGGVKVWPKEQTLLMQTHENAVEQRFQLDFCWDSKYIQMNNVYSTTHPNGSILQAFRAGFREGCKMSVISGENVDPSQLSVAIHQKNLKRLLVWMSVGADVPNGKWAMYGARLGLIESNLNKDFDITQIRDYDWFKDYFLTVYDSVATSNEMFNSIMNAMAKTIQQDMGLPCATLTPEQSKFFKFVYEAPLRTDAFRTEIEVDREGN